MLKTWLLLLMGSLLSGQAAHAAAEEEDEGIDRQYRVSATLGGALSDRLDWSLAQTLYFDRDFRMYAYTPQAALTWRAANWLSLVGGYRAARVDDEGSVWIRHRLFGNALFRVARHDWQLRYRLRWQGDWRDPDEDGRRYRSYLRNQLLLQYGGFERVTPYGAAEILHRLDAGRATSGVDRTLYRVGSEVAFTRRQGMDLYARKWVYANNDPDDNAVALEYALTFN